ncbi:MAG: hypothetical protein HW414_884 [Dehalococcoidia bacterium]|nr:hypothetical protein [Dehalococcoidia bacterium]
MADKLAWDFVVLHPLRDGNPTHLKTIYTAIGEGLKEGGYINPKVFKVDGRWGDRPNYTHVVRSTMSSLKKRGMVERLGKGKRTGVYRITDAGAKSLEEIEP